jgi:hypothetical protein
MKVRHSRYSRLSWPATFGSDLKSIRVYLLDSSHSACGAGVILCRPVAASGF